MGIVRWGIAGSGAISEDFALGILASSKASLQAVAARSKKRAEEFARAHGAKQAYEGYDALAKDPEVDVVYVGVTNQEHKRVSELFLRRGKGVLCEKPATTSRSETNELINISQRTLPSSWRAFGPGSSLCTPNSALSSPTTSSAASPTLAPLSLLEMSSTRKAPMKYSAASVVSGIPNTTAAFFLVRFATKRMIIVILISAVASS
jgi:hypothetical protein